MAPRIRYKQVDQLLSSVIIADTVVFLLYLVFAGLGITALKVLTAIIALVGSALCLAYLYKLGEFNKRRSRWLVMGFAAIILCTVVSLVLNYPSPAPDLAGLANAAIPTT